MAFCLENGGCLSQCSEFALQEAPVLRRTAKALVLGPKVPVSPPGGAGHREAFPKDMKTLGLNLTCVKAPLTPAMPRCSPGPYRSCSSYWPRGQTPSGQADPRYPKETACALPLFTGSHHCVPHGVSLVALSKMYIHHTNYYSHIIQLGEKRKIPLALFWICFCFLFFFLLYEINVSFFFSGKKSRVGVVTVYR